MHVAADFNWFLQFVVLVVSVVWGLLYVVRDAASRYFVVDSNFDSSATDYTFLHSRKREKTLEAGTVAGKVSESCAVCGLPTTKQCSRCKMIKYCSEVCQINHWKSEHKSKCSNMQSLNKAKHKNSKSILSGRKVSLVPAGGSHKIPKQSNKILFPYEEFVAFFNCDRLGYPPCGLLNCGNSCFANVVLQCLAYTKPLVAYVLEKGHRIECQRDEWCFLCEFQTHVERASQSRHPFSPINILSRLPNIGGNLGYGKQEDAHEFMRFAIDTMQSVCLDEFGGERAVHPVFQETTLIQHIFGGRLRSQVICAECNNISNQFENMMDLTVEIHGDAGSLVECLDQFTAEERLHGDNMYKCDGCNAYVTAWKRLTVQRSPNILTIALKRFQSGRFGKLNKRVTFPETLDLRPYISELEDENDVYKLYAVIVHVDMLNASFFGHYICYVKDFRGNWYRIDDCKVDSVELDEVLSQGAYMLLYSRITARSSCLVPTDPLQKEESNKIGREELHISSKQPAECLRDALFLDSPMDEHSSSKNSMANANFDEGFIYTTQEEASSGNNKGAVSDHGVNVEIHGTVALPMAPEIAASPANCACQISHSATSSSINEIEEFHSSLKQPAECLRDAAVCFDIPLECELSSSKNSPLPEVNIEELMLDQEDISGDDLVPPTGSNVEIQETLALPIASEGATTPVNCANQVSHSANLPINRADELHSSLKKPAECGHDAVVCLSCPRECQHLSCESFQGTEVNLEEEVLLTMDRDDASGHEERPVSNLVVSTGMNLEICAPGSLPGVLDGVGSVNHANPISHSVGLSTQTYARDSKSSTSISHVVSTGSETRSNVNGGLLRKPTEESTAMQTCTFVEDNMHNDFSASCSTEVQGDINSDKVTSLNGNGLLPSDRIRSAVEKANGEISGTSLKDREKPKVTHEKGTVSTETCIYKSLENGVAE